MRPPPYFALTSASRVASTEDRPRAGVTPESDRTVSAASAPSAAASTNSRSVSELYVTCVQAKAP